MNGNRRNPINKTESQTCLGLLYEVNEDGGVKPRRNRKFPEKMQLAASGNSNRTWKEGEYR